MFFLQTEVCNFSDNSIIFKSFMFNLLYSNQNEYEKWYTDYTILV